MNADTGGGGERQKDTPSEKTTFKKPDLLGLTADIHISRLGSILEQETTIKLLNCFFASKVISQADFALTPLKTTLMGHNK